MTPETRARRDGIRECGCPSWVIRCAHFENDGLVLIRRPSPLQCDCWRRRDAVTGDLYIVARIVDTAPCPTTGAAMLHGSRTPTMPFVPALNIESAERAFHEAEQRLLTGDA